MASVDGRIDCAMTEQIESGDEYYEALAELGCPSLLMGRVTMQLHYAAAEPFVAKEPAPIGRQAVHVARRAGGYLVAVDTHGSLCWPAGEFDGQPLLVITSEKCAAEYAGRSGNFVDCGRRGAYRFAGSDGDASGDIRGRAAGRCRWR